MKADECLRHASQQLADAGVATARLDSLVLMEDILNTNRTQILAHPEQEITGVNLQRFQKLIARRVRHVPLAYVRRKTEFYGHEFIINTHVLEPRPESETMVEMLAAQTPIPRTIVDVGTGSGALAITAKLLVPRAVVYALDIDEKCLQLAKRNATRLSTEITFLSGDLLQPMISVALNTPVALLCNLPYVPEGFHLNRAATHEPRRALFGGPDGLNLYRELFQQIHELPYLPELIFTEALPPQHQALKGIAKDAGYMLSQTQGFIQLFVPAESR